MGQLTQRTVTAAQWRVGSSIGQGVLQFGVGILLARVLPPSDFGLVALAMVVVGFVTMFADLGVGAAVVQRAGLSERHIRVSFTLSVVVGLAITLLVLLAAPVSAKLMHDDAVPGVLRWLAASFLVAGLGVTARALLQRALDFRTLSLTGLASYTVGYLGVAVPLAFLGHGVFSLVAGTLVAMLLSSVLAYAAVRHSLRPLLARAELADLFGFGFGISLNQVVNYVARNGDNFLVGRLLGTYSLGLYARAYNLMTLPVNHFALALTRVLFPAFSQINADRDRLRRAYLMSVQVMTLAAAPIMAGMLVAAPHLIVGLYGEAWAGAVLPLQLLCAVGVFRSVYHLSGALTQASGKVYAELVRQLVYAGLIVGGVLLGSRYGINGVAAAVAGAITVMYLAMAQLSLRILDSGWTAFLRAQLPGFALGLLTGVVALAVRLTLEHYAVGSLTILLGTAVACAATLPLGLALLPEGSLPDVLRDSLTRGLARLPLPLGDPLRRLLRLSVS